MFACFSPKDVSSMRAGTLSALPIAGSQQKRCHQPLFREIINGRKNMQLSQFCLKNYIYEIYYIRV